MDESARGSCGSGRRMVDAVRDDGVRDIALDRFVEIDVPIVDRQRKARNEPRLQDDANRLGRRLFRAQVRVAAEQAVILARWIPWRSPACCKTRRDTAIIRCRDQAVRARILRAVETSELRREQLLDVWSTNRPVIRAAEPDVGDPRELARNPV